MPRAPRARNKIKMSMAAKGDSSQKGWDKGFKDLLFLCRLWPEDAWEFAAMFRCCSNARQNSIKLRQSTIAIKKPNPIHPSNQSPPNPPKIHQKQKKNQENTQSQRKDPKPNEIGSKSNQEKRSKRVNQWFKEIIYSIGHPLSLRACPGPSSSSMECRRKQDGDRVRVTCGWEKAWVLQERIGKLEGTLRDVFIAPFCLGILAVSSQTAFRFFLEYDVAFFHLTGMWVPPKAYEFRASDPGQGQFTSVEMVCGTLILENWFFFFP